MSICQDLERQGYLMDLFESTIREKFGPEFHAFEYNNGQYYNNHVQRFWITFQEGFKLAEKDITSIKYSGKRK